MKQIAQPSKPINEQALDEFRQEINREVACKFNININWYFHVLHFLCVLNDL